jgi:hypothetical protein
VFQTDYIAQEPLSVRAGDSASVTSLVFAGAKVVDVVNDYAEAHDIVLFDRLIDWGWFPFLTQPLFWVINFFYSLLGNFGLAILATTVVVKIFFFPLANKSYVAMSAMKKLQPEMMKIKERYGDDRMKQQEAMMALYKKQKVSPLSGCLPIVVQIPVFFALYKVLYVTIEMRHAPFYGWIRDLSAADPTIAVQPVRAHPVVAAGAADRGRAADPHGAHHVGPDEAQPDAAGPPAGQAVQPDAAGVHLHPGAVPGRSRAVLDLEQPAVDHPAIRHHEAPGRRDKPAAEHPGKPAELRAQEAGIGRTCKPGSQKSGSRPRPSRRAGFCSPGRCAS